GIVAVIRKHDVEPGRLPHLADNALVELVVVGDEDPSRIVKPANENRRVTWDDDEPDRHANGEVGVGVPDRGYENDAQEQNNRDDAGTHQPGNAEAKAIAQDGPQEQGIEDRASFAGEIDHQADRAEI